MVEMLFCEDDSRADKATAKVQNTLMPTSLETVTNLCIHHDSHQKNPPNELFSVFGRQVLNGKKLARLARW